MKKRKSKKKEISEMRKFIKRNMKLGMSKDYAIGYQYGLKKGKEGFRY